MNTIHSWKKIGKNAGYNFLGYFVSIITLFLITPYSLHILGKERFGLWALISVITSFATLTNLGVDQALVKYIAEDYKQKDIASIKRMVSTALPIYILSIGTASVAIFLSVEFIAISIFNISVDLLQEFSFVLKGIIIAFFFRTVFSVFRSVLLGMQRFDLDNINLIITRIVSLIGVYLFLAFGFGLKGLVYNNYIISFLAIALNLFFVGDNLRQIPFSVREFSLIELKRIFKYSINVFSSSIINMIQEPVIKTAITNLNNLTFVTYYDIGNRIPSMMKNSFGSAMDVIVPASAVMNLDGTKQNLTFYLAIQRLIILIALPVFILIGLIAKPFILLWIGSGYDYVVMSIYFLLVVHFLGLSATPAVKIFLGIGKPIYTLFDSVFSVSILIILIFPLSSLMGYYGFLTAILISYICSNIFLNYFCSKSLNTGLLAVIKTLPFKALLFLIAVTFLLGWPLMIIKSFSWILLISYSGFFLLVYISGILLLKLTNDFERSLFISFYNKLTGLLRLNIKIITESNK